MYEFLQKRSDIKLQKYLLDCKQRFFTDVMHAEKQMFNAFQFV
jgi:hypothetical protein